MKYTFFKIAASLFMLTGFGPWLFGQNVSRDDARQVALRFFNTRAKEPVTDMRQVLRPANFAQTNMQEAYYVFEPLRGKGFVMVSADKNATPILGYSIENNFVFESMSPQTRIWVGRYEQQINTIRAKHYKARPETVNAWLALESTTYTLAENQRVVWPLLKTEWGQGTPYNYWTPFNASGQHAVTGCVATAMAQIMRYWEWPSGNIGAQYVEYDDDEGDIQGTFFGQIGGGQYDWSSMPNDLSDTQSPVSMALLMYHAGLSVEMNYGLNNSGAESEDVPEALNEYFSYEEGDYLERSDFSDDEWHNMLETSINNGIPVYYRGPGHAWVCDGYDGHMMHMNWGWNGGGNGFYHLDNLVSSNYNDDQKAVFGIVPQGMQCPQTYFSSDVVYGSYTTQYWISAQSDIFGATSATFSAGDSITLRPGFDAYAGCTFVAKIGGCNGNFQGGNPGGARSIQAREATPREATQETSPLTVAPNPFSAATTITYTLYGEKQVSIQLLDATGKLIDTPFPLQTQVAGEHQLHLDAGNLPAGLYFLVLQLGEIRQTKQLILSK